MYKIYVKKIEDIELPSKKSEGASGYDIIATSNPKIVGELCFDTYYKQISYIEYETNLFIAPELTNIHTFIYPRSSISKYNLVLANSVGLCDNDYRGMIICRFKYIWNPEDFNIIINPNTCISHGDTLEKPFLDSNNAKLKFNILGNINYNKIYKKGDSIAQLVFGNVLNVDFEIVDDLTKTKRGENGFGSSDTPVRFWHNEEKSHPGRIYRKNDFILKESIESKGGLNKCPTISPPSEPLKGQGYQSKLTTNELVDDIVSLLKTHEKSNC